MNKKLVILISFLLIFIVSTIYGNFNKSEVNYQDNDQYREILKDWTTDDDNFINPIIPKSSLSWDPKWEKSFSGGVLSTSISADGNLIAVAGEFNKVYLYNKSGDLLWDYNVGGWVYDIMISANGKYVAVGTSGNRVILLNATNYANPFLWNCEPAGAGATSSISISSDGNYIAAGFSFHDYVYVWNRLSSTWLWRYSVGNEPNPSFSSDGKIMAAGCNSPWVYIFNTSNSADPFLTRYYTGSKAYQVALSSDGKYIAAGCKNSRVFLFNRTSDGQLWNYTTNDIVYSVAISNDAKYVVGGSRDGNVYLFNATNAITPLLWYSKAGSRVYDVAISSGCEKIVTGSNDGKVFLFDKVSSIPLWSKTLSNVFYDVSISSDGKYISAGSYNKHVYLFQWIPPSQFNLFSDANTPERDGSFNLNWEISNGADNYSIYEYDHYITEINESLIELKNGSISNTYPISNLYTGEYYYIIVAFNQTGFALSNCIKIVVDRNPLPFNLSSDADEPDDDGAFNLTWDASIGADNYSVFVYDKYITEINESVDELANGITKLNYSIPGLRTDIYYYIIEAYNKSGSRLSNCIKITVHSPPGPFELISDADNPDNNGKFILSWNISVDANNYTVYQYDSFISEINESLTIISSEINLFNQLVEITSNGKYFFIIEAHNEYGNTISNCIEINITLGPPGSLLLFTDAENPDIGCFFNLTWNASIGADKYSIYIHNSYISEINESVIKFANDLMEFNYSVTTLFDGIYYFKVVAFNDYGNASSNCIEVTVTNGMIYIDGDEDFKWSYAVKSGEGIEIDPYIISDWYINRHSLEKCVEIKNTRKYFEIRDCTIINATFGIRIENASNFKIFNCRINKMGADGIDGIDGQPNNHGTDGTGGIGIYIVNDENFNVSFNRIFDIKGGNGGNGGIGADWISKGNGGNGGVAIGLFINNTNNGMIRLNNFTEIIGGDGGKGGRGYEGYQSLTSAMGGKGGHGGIGGFAAGIFIENSTVINNNLNQIHKVSSGNGGDGGRGGHGQPIVIMAIGGNGGNGNSANQVSGIYIKNSRAINNSLNLIKNIIAGYGGNGGNGGNGGSPGGNPGGDGGRGGYGGSSNGIIIMDSKLINNIQNTILNLYSGKGGDGGDGGDSVGSVGGSCGNGGNGRDSGFSSGIYLENSNSTKSIGNNISYLSDNNGGSGGLIGAGSGTHTPGIDGENKTGGGFYLILHCRYNEFNKNNVSYNVIGIYILNNCDNNTFLYNLIYNNSNYGVIIYNNLGECNYNLFYLNNFSNPICINAYDNGTNTQWDNGTIGNWWHDYTGTDINDDLRGDIPYNISGLAKSKDYYPIWDDGPDIVKPSINFLIPLHNETIIIKGTFNITVSIIDDNPPIFGDVLVYIFNSSYDLMFNITMIYNGGSIWSYLWDNVSLYNDGKVYIIRVWATDSSPQRNTNMSISMYVSINIEVYKGGGPTAGDDDGGEKVTEEADLTFIIIGVVGVTSGVFVGVIVLLIKKGIIGSSKLPKNR